MTAPRSPFLPSRRQLGVLAFAMLAATTAVAQGEYPDKPIRIVVPYAPGGSSDTLGRLIA